MITFLVHVTETGSLAKKGGREVCNAMGDFPYKSSAEGLIDFLPLPSLLVNSGRELMGVNAEGRNLFKNLKMGEDLAFSTRNQDILEALDTLKSGATQVEKDIVLSNQNDRSFHLTARTLLPEDSGKGLYLMVFTDVTYQREAEKIRASFIANVSHELRSPLSTLIGAIETLKTTARDDPGGQERFLGMMEEESWRMKRLVDDLLSLSKLEAHEHVPPRGELDLGKLLSQVKGTMEARLKARNMKLAIKLNRDIPVFPGDWDELQEVFDNLIDNAVKYGKAGSKITITAEYKKTPKGLNEPAVIISVHNFGEVIPGDQIPRLTERFYRVDKSRSRELGGTGLGLAIVKHIIKHHRGKLQVSSSASEGTKFSIILPARKP